MKAAAKQEIIIKCQLEEMIKPFFKESVIVWHDPDLNLEENQQDRTELEKLCPVKTFREWEKSSIYVKETEKICHVITSGKYGEQLVKEICSNDHVSEIYVFCKSKDEHSNLTKFSPKISCVGTEIKDIIRQIQQKLLEWHKQESSRKLNLPVFAPIFNDAHKSQINHLQRFLRVIPNFENREQARNDFVDLSRGIYLDKENFKLIETFKQKYNQYNMAEILKWYTRDSFLFKVTNNCLRIATSDSIQYCRLILKDIQSAIREQYQIKSKNLSGLLYRGAYLSEEEWSSLKENMGRDIEMHGFLSASKETRTALRFVSSDPRKKVFITIIVPKGPNEEEQGFAEVEEFSEFSPEKEVLFNVRSRFTILETEEKYSEKLPTRHLVLLYGAQGFRKFLAENKSVQEILIPKKISCTCSSVSSELDRKLMFIPLINPANNNYYCKACLPNLPDPLLCVPTIHHLDTNKLAGCFLNKGEFKIPFYGYQCAKCQARKKKSYYVCTHCDKERNKWCENCFESSSDCMKLGHTVIFERSPFSFWFEQMSQKELNHLKIQNDLVFEGDLFQLAQMHFESHEYGKAADYYKTFIEQNEEMCRDDKLLTSYSKLAITYNEQGEHEKGLEYCLKSLDLGKSLYGDEHKAVADSYHRLGIVYENKGKIEKAVECYLKSLDIHKSLYGDSLLLALSAFHTYNNLGVIYTNQEKYEKALEYYFKALESIKLIYGEIDPRVATCCNNLATVYGKKGDYKEALDYYSKALDISKSVYGEIHPGVADSINNIGGILDDQGKDHEALENFAKALHIRKLVYGDNHPDVAASCCNVGKLYNKLGKGHEALKYNFKALEIQKSIFGGDHLHIATSYNHIGISYDNLEEEQKALEYHFKALEIRKSAYGDNHPDVAISYNNIGTNYMRQKELQKALEYFFRSLKIMKLFYGEKHIYIGICYSNIALIYDNQAKFQEALNFYLKSLDIRKAFYGDDHPETTRLSPSIGRMYIELKDFKKGFEYLLKSFNGSECVGEDYLDSE